MLGRVLVACKGSGRSLVKTTHPLPILRAHAFQTSFFRFASSTTPVNVAPRPSLDIPSSSSPSHQSHTKRDGPASASPSSGLIDSKSEPKSRIQNSSRAISNRKLKAMKFHLGIPEPLVLLNLTGFRRVVIPQAVAVRDHLAQRTEEGSINPVEFIDEMNKLETKRVLKIPQDLYDSKQCKWKFGKFIKLPSFNPRSFRRLISAAKAAISYFLVIDDRPNLIKAKRELRFLEEHYNLYFPDIAVHTDSLSKAFSTFAKKKADPKHLAQLMKTGGVEAMIAYRRGLGSNTKMPPVVKIGEPTPKIRPLSKRIKKNPVESIPTQRKVVSEKSGEILKQVKAEVVEIVGKVQEGLSEVIGSASNFPTASSANTSKNPVESPSDKGTPTSVKEQGSGQQLDQSRSDP